MGDGNLGQIGERYRSGGMTMTELLAAAAPVLERTAFVLMRQWRSNAQVDDVVQEMRIELARRVVRAHDPARASLDRRLMWGVCVGAKRVIHKERGALQHGSRDRNPSRAPLVFSQLGNADREFSVDDVTWLEPQQEHDLDRKRAIEEVARAAFGDAGDAMAELRRALISDKGYARILRAARAAGIGGGLDAASVGAP